MIKNLSLRSSTKSNYCLYERQSSYVQRSDSLRSRAHDFVLPVLCSSNLHKQSFIFI